jgi:hypothetical protein
VPRHKKVGAWSALKTDDQHRETAIAQDQSTGIPEELVDFARPPRADHEQLDRRGMLGEIVEKGASEKNDVDFDIGIVVFAAPQMNVAGYETPIIPRAIGPRLCGCQHPQRSASP